MVTPEQPHLDAHARANEAWGFAEPRPEQWSAGPWAFERRGDELANLSFDGTMVLRAIRAVARDRDWQTLPVEILEVHSREVGLELKLQMAGFGIELEASLLVDATDGLRVVLSGTCITDFWRNRLGLVVLHPPDVAGSPLTVIHSDSRSEVSAFPQEISPHQPAVDIVGMRWSVDGVDAHLTFEGEIFEMEDQRNWTDASFKTYSTPLQEPFPVFLAAGTSFTQALHLNARRVAKAVSTRDSVLRLVDRGTMPAIAVGAATAQEGGLDMPPPPASAVLVEIDARSANRPAILRRARTAGLPLDVRLVVQSSDEIAGLLDLVEAYGTGSVVRLGVFGAKSHVTEPNLWGALVGEVARRGLSIDLVAGARSHFTEFNRTSSHLPADAPAVTISVTPQMHVRERSQIVESLSIQTEVLKNAHRIAGGRPVHVGPVTLRPRFNAVATTPPPEEPDNLTHGYGPERLADSVDPRQHSAAVGAWVVASVAALAGAESICYFEEWGPRGIRDSQGSLDPAGHALSILHSLTGHHMSVAETPEVGINVIAAISGEDVSILAANLTPDQRTLSYEGAGLSGSVTVGAFSFVHIGGPDAANPLPSKHAGLS